MHELDLGKTMDNVFLNEALKRLLNLPTHPVSVKYIGTFDENVEWDLADLGFYRPRNPVNLCQGVGLARHHGRKVLLAAEDMACIIGAAAGGLYPFDKTLASGEIGVKDGFRCNPEFCREMFETLPRIEHSEVEAVAFAPLKEMPFGGVDQETSFLPDYFTEESKGRMGRKS
jgi:uncharacterized protein (DUF169 family)